MVKKFKIRYLPGLIVDTAKQWFADKPFRLSAAIAYYAVLSLPALLIIIINVIGVIWGKEIVQGKLTDEIAGALGNDVADTVQTMAVYSQGDDKKLISSVIGIGILIFGSTGAFYQLQLSLNKVWRVKPDPKVKVMKIILYRTKSFGFILVLGFLLLISLVFTAGISVLAEYIQSNFSETALYITRSVNIVASLGIITLLFALMFKYLPDARIEWRAVWPGALITALLFVLGKFLLGIYFGKAEPGLIYGAAGSVILILLWISYSCLILFFGAIFTRLYAERYTSGIRPGRHALRIKEKEIVLEKGKGDEPRPN